MEHKKGSRAQQRLRVSRNGNNGIFANFRSGLSTIFPADSSTMLALDRRREESPTYWGLVEREVSCPRRHHCHIRPSRLSRA